MAVIDPETTSVDLIIGIYGKVGAFLKLYLPLLQRRQTAESYVTESRTVLQRKEVILRMISLEILPQIVSYRLDITHMELLKTDDIRILFHYKPEHRISTLRS